MLSVGVAILCSVISRYLVTQKDELLSETVCWVFLPVIAQIAKRYVESKEKASYAVNVRPSNVLTSARTWLFALGVTVSCWYRAEECTVVLFPALTPMLLFSGIHPPAAAAAAESRSIWDLVPAKWSYSLIAVFSCLTLVASGHTPLPSLALCAVVVSLLYAGYFAISRPTATVNVDPEATGEQGKHDYAEGASDAEDLALSLAICVLPLLSFAMSWRLLVLGEPNGASAMAVMVGLIKALSWFFTLKATCDTSWLVAGTIGTFGLTSTHSEFQPSYMHASSYLAASLLSLGQTINLVPKGTKPRLGLWALGVLPILHFLQVMYKVDDWSMPFQPEQHPVEILARTALADFDAMLLRQSRTYTAAVAEYRRRYRIDPPPGFEDWYHHAVAQQSPIIDEFDMIYEVIAPFLNMSGQRVREAMAEASGTSGVDLYRCQFTGQSGGTKCRHPTRSDGHIEEAFRKWLASLTGKIPDLEFLVNPLDEPRVIRPGKSAVDERVKVSNLSRRSVWDALTKDCPWDMSNASSDTSTVADGIDTHGLPFVTDIQTAKDLCRHPEYRDMHGMTMNPTSFILIEGNVPVLSVGSLSTMGDILFPSPAYGYAEFMYDEEKDMDWDKKRNNLYWAGSTTGGYSHDDEWKKYHRHRFVALARGLEIGREYLFLRERDGVFDRVASPFLNGDLFDVSFTEVIQCRSDICDSERDYFDVQPRADKDAALGSKLVFDIDGNGISGRFLKLLMSRSAVLKQTLLREWHDERLVAWVHYIPVSESLDELPELVTWLTQTEEGTRRANAIAEGGREWAARAMREEDRALYVYRLFLELARLQDPDREAM